MQDPLAHAVAPVHPLPPHWPHSVWPPVAAAEVVVDALDVVVVVVRVEDLEVVVVLATVVVDALLLLLVVVVAEVLFTEDVVDADDPPGTMAELVTVATLLLCATLLGNPVYRVGPGIV